MNLFRGNGMKLLASSVVLLGMLMAACGGDSNGGSATKDNNQGGAANAAPADQQVLRMRITGEPKTIDPQLTNFADETTLTKPLFSGLFTFDEDLKVVPNVAAEMPTADNGGISKDGLIYTIKLRKDAKWSDGKTVTANDFAYSLKRALDPKLAGPYTSFYFAIKGAEAYNTALGTKDKPLTPSDADLAKLRDTVGVTAKDETTVVYTLAEPSPSFLNVMALWTAFPVRQDVVEKFGDKWTEAGNHVSNGAFMLKEWKHNERIILVPNPNWFGTPKPQLQQIKVLFMDDDAAAYAAYLNNELDIVGVPPANRREVATAGSPLNKELLRKNELTTFALFMNNKMAPFDNLKVRQAFATAFDRKAFVEVVLPGRRPADNDLDTRGHARLRRRSRQAVRLQPHEGEAASRRSRLSGRQGPAQGHVPCQLDRHQPERDCAVRDRQLQEEPRHRCRVRVRRLGHGVSALHQEPASGHDQWLGRGLAVPGQLAAANSRYGRFEQPHPVLERQLRRPCEEGGSGAGSGEEPGPLQAGPEAGTRRRCSGADLQP